jgi:hypothetical protein
MRHSTPLRAFRFVGGLAALTVVLSLTAPAARSQVTVYFNDFEANTNGFSLVNRENLTTDPTGGGGSSSFFHGRFGNGSTTLSLTGLTPGVVHTVEFDLYIGATMDGDEPISLAVAGGPTLLNTTFSNFFTQAYSDSDFLDTNRDKNPFTGADISRQSAPSNTDRFSIYFFSHGAGNPVLTFTPTAATASLTWTGSNMQDATDEFWALDNVRITAPALAAEAPEPGTLSLLVLAAGGIGIAGVVRRRRVG